MSEFPSKAELIEMYRDVMENEDVAAIASWTLHNTDEPTDEAAYIENAEKISPELFPVIDRAIKNI